ncbi:MAG: glycerol-3-phosphate 1-O-acyltransferase PlsY [Erysipelotrichaceae bacterium]|nr:glycerol-3-phosphate 1-O-acyltransferase PlsY [Erysipelotrichaceae bacterium]
MKTILVIILSYLFGSIPWGLVIGKVFFHKDIRKEGSGNIGGTNAGRILGKPAGIAVILLDALKGYFAMVLAYYLAKDAIVFAGLASVIGHCFPVFVHFHGGKAVATTFGFFLGIATLVNGHIFWQFIFPVLCFLFILYLTKMVSLSSITAVFIEAVVSIFINTNKLVPVSVFILWILLTYRHKSNIERIKNGTESKIKWM